jgi:hypothetical protein
VILPSLVRWLGLGLRHVVPKTLPGFSLQAQTLITASAVALPRRAQVPPSAADAAIFLAATRVLVLDDQHQRRGVTRGSDRHSLREWQRRFVWHSAAGQ